MGKFTLYIRTKRIPEWRDYYINYKFLKKILKNIRNTSKIKELSSEDK